MGKIIPTHEQCLTIKKCGLRYDDVRMGPNDGEVTIKDTWKSGATDRWYVIGRDGTFSIEYNAPVIKW